MGLIEVVKARGVGAGDKANSLDYAMGCKSELTMRFDSVFNHVSLFVVVLLFLFIILNSLTLLCNNFLVQHCSLF